MVRTSTKYRFNNSFLLWFILLTLNFMFFLTLNSFAATQVSFEWDPNSEPDLAGYRVFCREQGQNYDYANPSWEGIDTTCTIFNLDDTKTYYFVARAYDTQGLESADSKELRLEPVIPQADQMPIANAGPDQTVGEGQIVLLDGSNSTDPDDGIASYHWSQTGGPAVNLSNPDIQQPTFTTPDVGPEGASLIFELIIVDYGGNQSTDVCAVNVTWLNEPPQSNAGADQTVMEGTVVTLDGSASLDIDDGIVSYLWTQTGVPTVTLSNSTSSQPSFTAPDVGSDGMSLTFYLTVTDAGGLKNTDSCIVNISWQNAPPTAVVTPDYIEASEGTLIKLDGSNSKDSDDGISSYLWTQNDGDPVTLSNPTSAVATFTAPKSDPLGKNLKFKLTVKDLGGLQGTADSSVYVMQNEPVTLNSVTIIGPTQVDAGFGAQYALTASYSDGSSTNVSSSAGWSENSSYASISSSGYLTTVSVASDQSCTITANYGGQSATHNVMIGHVSPNKPPVANFSYDTGRKKEITFIDRSTDGDGTIVSWFWDFGDGETSTEQNPTHRYRKFDNYSVTLTVTDDAGAKNSTSESVGLTN